MSQREVTIDNRLGLHARAAAKFVHLACSFASNIHVVKGNSRVDGKSILGLLTLAACKGTRISLHAEGSDENDALGALCGLVSSRFGEDS